MCSGCKSGQFTNNDAEAAKGTGTIPVNSEFDGASQNSTKYGDKTPAQQNDKPTETGW
jgi:hypothetical protein